MRWIDRAMERYVDHRERRLRALVVDGHDHERPFFWRTMAAFVVGIGAVIVLSWWPTGAASMVACGVLGWTVGVAAFGSWNRASAYRCGWLDGRERFIEQMQSHYQRGNSAEDWLRTEGDHDMVHVLGLPPLPGRYDGPVEWDN